MKRKVSSVIEITIELALVTLFMFAVMPNKLKMNEISTIENQTIIKTIDVSSGLFLEADEIAENLEHKVVATYTGNLTGYGNDCHGCTTTTASGYSIAQTITYLDKEYGEIRIVAADRSIPFYSIVKISNIPNMDPVYAIVLDRGKSVGFTYDNGKPKPTMFDLLFENEQVANSTIGLRKNIKYEILRLGK